MVELREISKGFLVPMDTHIGNWQNQCQRLDHDNWLLPQIVELIKPGNIVYDLGAFNGDHTIAYSLAVGETGKVIAVEPGRIAFKCLERNLRYFKHENVQCYRCVISDTNLQFYEHIENGNLGASKTERCYKPLDTDSILSLTIDDLVNANGTPNIIKIDIEGFEAKALRGAEQTLHKHRPIFVVEVNRGALAIQANTPEQIRDIFSDHNYAIKKIVPHDASWTISPQFDVFAYPL